MIIFNLSFLKLEIIFSESYFDVVKLVIQKSFLKMKIKLIQRRQV